NSLGSRKPRLTQAASQGGRHLSGADESNSLLILVRDHAACSLVESVLAARRDTFHSYCVLRERLSQALSVGVASASPFRSVEFSPYENRSARIKIHTTHMTVASGAFGIDDISYGGFAFYSSPRLCSVDSLLARSSPFAARALRP